MVLAVYLKDGRIKVIDELSDVVVHESLLGNGWVKASMYDPCIFIEALYNDVPDGELRKVIDLLAIGSEQFFTRNLKSDVLKFGVRLRFVNWVLPPFRGMCIPPFGIYIRKEFKSDSRVLEHELIHWKQYKRMGLFMYYFRYFIQLLIIGYDTMPMEMEARQNEEEKTKWNYREKYHK